MCDKGSTRPRADMKVQIVGSVDLDMEMALCDNLGDIAEQLKIANRLKAIEIAATIKDWPMNDRLDRDGVREFIYGTAEIREPVKVS